MDYIELTSTTTGPLPGDVNNDGFVGGVDATTIIGNWGMTGAGRTDGDLSGDGNVGGPDYSEVLSNWGNGSLPAEPIPEPGTLLALSCGVIAVFLRRR